MLNAEQFAAVSANTGAWKVESCAGTGKTRVITERYKRLRAEGVPENEIISLTFTRAAADEMRERAGAAKGGRGGFRTFHSFALNLLLEERMHLPFRLADDPIPHDGKIPALLRKVLRDYPCIRFREAREYISLQKRSGRSPAEAVREAGLDPHAFRFAQAYAEYERRMRAEGWLDFDSIQFEALRLLQTNGGVNRRWNFNFVQCDEAQDCEKSQWEMVREIVCAYGNVFCVGDSNQALYGWRGAATELFLNMESMFPSLRTLYLGLNYRSTAQIVEYCREIAPVRTPLIEHMRANGSDGPAPEFRRYSDDLTEAEEVIAGMTVPGECAVLVRTNRQLRAFEDTCIRRGLRYNLLGRSGFWQRSEVQDLLAFLRFAVAPWDDAAIARIIKSPYACAKYLGTAFLKKLPKPYFAALKTFYADDVKPFQLTAARKLHTFLSGLRACVTPHMSAERATRIVAEQSGMLAHYMRKEDDAEESADNLAAENIEEVAQAATRFRNADELLAHAHRAVQAAKSQKGLTLSTVHQAKGREWAVVYVCGVSDEILPHAKGDYEEEQRIYYVACSRPAQRLIVTCHGRPSVFIAERIPNSISVSEMAGTVTDVA